MAQHIYDYIVIGSGLTGLTIAAALSRETKNIALVEASDFPRGMNRGIQFPVNFENAPLMNNGLRVLPNTASGQQVIDFLENLLRLKLNSDVIEESPVTYENGQLKSFLGFGDHPPEFYEELSYFIQHEMIQLNLEPHQWTQLLFEQFKGDFFPRSYVTKFQCAEERVQNLVINGSKTLVAQNYIFTGQLSTLGILIPDEFMSFRQKSKLGKGPYWTALCLDICHNHVVTESLAMHVLNGTTQDDLGPCVGRFQSAVQHQNDGQIQVSQWVTFLNKEDSEDNEIIGHALKKIKRQIKRAYPEALEGMIQERIVVAPMIGGDGDLKLNANQTFGDLENLWIASAPVNTQKNLIGALSQAQLVLAALGFEVKYEKTELIENIEAQNSEAVI